MSKPNKPKTTTTDAILGKAKILKEVTYPTTCLICEKTIPAERLEALKLMNTTRDRWTCIGCSQVSKVKGLYLGESGTSQLQICTRVYNDSVRSVFKSAETDLEDNSEEEKV